MNMKKILLPLVLVFCFVFGGCGAFTGADGSLDSSGTEGLSEHYSDIETEAVVPPAPCFGKYFNGSEGVENGYEWVEEKNAFVTKQGTDGDSAYYLAGEPLTVDYSFIADISFDSLLANGGFFMTAKINNSGFVRFGIEALSNNRFNVFSSYATDGKEINKRIHLYGETYNSSVNMGIVVYRDTVAMVWNGDMVYQRTLEGISGSTLVISGKNQMIAEIRNISAENESEAVYNLYTKLSESYREPLVGSIQGKTAGDGKIKEDPEGNTVTVLQKNEKTNSPAFVFYHNGNEVFGDAWAIRGIINAKSSTESGHIRFTCYQDARNVAHIYINRREGTNGKKGSNGIWQHIINNGVRTPASANEHVSENLIDTSDWTAEFVFLYREGIIELYLKEEGEDMTLMTRYETQWEKTYARFEVVKYADVVLSEMTVTVKNDEVAKMQTELSGIPQDPIASARVLFIGNSATYVNDIPGTLMRLARKAGYNVEAASVTKGGATLAQHADASSDHGKNVLAEIGKGYDFVFIQDNGNCISSAAMKNASKKASEILNKAITASGAKGGIYIRPPYGYATSGFSPFDQCKEFDKLFTEISSSFGMENAYVNRAFAYAIKNTDYKLWGSDNAHTSEHGAYLAVCVFFSTLFDTSSTVLDSNGLPEQDARELQQIADKIVLEDLIPW